MLIKQSSKMPADAVARIFKALEPEIRDGLDPNGNWAHILKRVFPAAGGLCLPDHHDTRIHLTDDWLPFALGVMIGQHLASRGFLAANGARPERSDAPR